MLDASNCCFLVTSGLIFCSFLCTFYVGTSMCLKSGQNLHNDFCSIMQQCTAQSEYQSKPSLGHSNGSIRCLHCHLHPPWGVVTQVHLPFRPGLTQLVVPQLKNSAKKGMSQVNFVTLHFIKSSHLTTLNTVCLHPFFYEQFTKRDILFSKQYSHIYLVSSMKAPIRVLYK